MSRFIYCVILSILVLNGCGSKEPVIVKDIQMPPRYVPNNMSQGINLGLRVTDARVTTVAGQKRFGFESGTDIIIPDLAQPILDSLMPDLQSRGFVPVAFGTSDGRSLDIRILDVSYNNKGRVIAGSQDITIKLEAEARNNNNTMKRAFVTESSDTDFMVPSDSRQSEDIRLAISKVLAQATAKIVNDAELTYFLQNR